MHNKIHKAILKTLIYSDIFNYPLSQDELWKFLINVKLDKKSFSKQLKYLKKGNVKVKNNFYYLLGRENIVTTRIQRNNESRKKIILAKTIIKQLTFLPTIQFIGISGALSLGNSTKEDDIDLFVIVSKGRLWLTRLIMVIFLTLMGRYRRRNENDVSDKICLNMLIDDSTLLFSRVRQNLYTAHEIVQMIPVFDRNNTYNRFINTNKWVEKFLPNAFVDRGTTRNTTRNYGETFFSAFLRTVLRISALEHFAKAIQFWFIKKHITTETVSDNFLAFHPYDYKKSILKEYNKRLKRYEI